MSDPRALDQAAHDPSRAVIRQLDHVNVRTARLDELVQFYTEALGLRRGPRPPLGFPGAWMYAGDAAVVHLVGVTEQPQPTGALRLEHFAFAASGLGQFLQNLGRLGVDFKQSRQPGTERVVVNLYDPDGNRIHVDFPASEAAPG